MSALDYDRCAPDGPIHAWFGLTYSNYLVLPRTVLQSMPLDWQEPFVASLMELEKACAPIIDAFPSSYAVNVRRLDGRFERDPMPHYNRGRTRLLGLVGS